MTFNIVASFAGPLTILAVIGFVSSSLESAGPGHLTNTLKEPA